MYTCIILHNIIIEDEGVGIGMPTYIANRGEVYDRVVHHNLPADFFNNRQN